MRGERARDEHTLRLRRVHWRRSVAIGLGIVGAMVLSFCLVGYFLPQDLPLFPTLWFLLGGVILLVVVLSRAAKPLWASPAVRLVCRPPWVELFDAEGKQRLAAFNLERPHALLMVLRESPPRTQKHYGVAPSLWVEVYLAQNGACISWYAPWVAVMGKREDGTWVEVPAAEVRRHLLYLASLLAEPPWRAGLLRWHMIWPVGGRSRWVGLPAAQYEMVHPAEGLAAMVPLLKALDAYADANTLRRAIAGVRITGGWEALAGAFPPHCFS